MIEVHPGVIGLNGGTKQLWLRQHHSEVLRYYHEYGPDSCMIRFNLRKRTMENFLVSGHDAEKFTKSDKAIMIAKVAREDVAELRGEVRELRQQLEMVAPVCSVMYELGDAVARLAQLRSKNRLTNLQQSGEIERV